MLGRLKSLTTLFGVGVNIAGGALIVPLLSAKADPARTPTLTGVNISGAEYNGERVPGQHLTDYIYPTPSQLNYYAGKGMNVIRLPFAWERLQPNSLATLSHTELHLIDSVISSSAARGMDVIISPHNFGKYYSQPIGSPTSSIENFVRFWGQVGAHFKSNGKVIFGLMNEPVGIPINVWRVAAQGAVDAIRDAGAPNLILVPGVNWTGAHSWTKPTPGGGAPNAVAMLDLRDPINNYVYEVHQYLDEDFSGTSDRCQSDSIGVDTLREFTAWLEMHGQRGFLGEFGAGRNPTCLVGLDKMLGFIAENSRMWLGWTYWAGGAWWGDYKLGVEPVNGADTPQMAIITRHAHGTGFAGTSGASRSSGSN